MSQVTDILMDSPVKYVAEPKHVREVSIRGTADLGFWTDRLKQESLVPAASEGKAQLLIIAADMRFMGVRFRELSFSVLVCYEEAGVRQDAAYLAQAFNSCRFFAFCERTLFATPYSFGDVRVSTEYPASIHLIQGGEVVFRAEMGGDPVTLSREPSRCGEAGWQGPIFLPRHPRSKEPGELFFGRIRGYTTTYPFLDSRDTVAVNPSPANVALQTLVDSHFVLSEWAVRADATHAKSKTYTRSEVLGNGTSFAGTITANDDGVR